MRRSPDDSWTNPHRQDHYQGSGVKTQDSHQWESGPQNFLNWQMKYQDSGIIAFIEELQCYIDHVLARLGKLIITSLCNLVCSFCTASFKAFKSL